MSAKTRVLLIEDDASIAAGLRMNLRHEGFEVELAQDGETGVKLCLDFRPDLIILDEPTDVLEDRSRNDLFDVIHQLKEEQGVGFIYISHRYAEVYELGDRVVLHSGVVLGADGFGYVFHGFNAFPHRFGTGIAPVVG